MTQDFAHAVQQAPPPLRSTTTESNRTPFTWEASGLVFSFEFDEDRLRFRHVLPAAVAEPPRLPAPNAVSGLETSIHCTGEDIPDHHGAKLCGGTPGIRMRFVGRDEAATAAGRRLVLTHEDAPLGLRVESIYESLDGIAVVRRTTNVINISDKPVGIEYVSSAMLNNFASPDTFQRDLRIHFAHNSWQAEAQWRSLRPADAGLLDNGNFTVSGALFSTFGSWPCQSYLPMALVENERCKVIWFWQVEHNGSWHCEIAQTSVRTLYAYLGGPDAQHAQAWKMLQPGDTYKTVRVAIGCVRGGFEQAVAELTRYRRATLLHPRRDMRECPVVFNDAVVLGGDETTDKEIPLIDSASAAGCEVFCVDAGWSSRPGENWWGAVGDWEPNRDRFPGGFKQLIRYIRTKGMVAGLWIEPEVASPNSNLAKAPDAWFFMRHGRRVIDHSRYHLDFRNREVRAYIDRVFDRLVGDYGIGYIKLDYNINALEGTETGTESLGQGLLGHNRAFLAWMDTLLERYPDLTIETVASGSMRMEYSILSRAQLQSISDQGDFRMYSSLTTGCSAAVLPEQMGVWSQPARDATPDAASCNLVNAMLGRIHQSSVLADLPPETLAQVHRGIAVYKQQIRPHIPTFIPFYPIGMADLTTPTRPAALGMRGRERTFVAVWRREGPETVHFPWRDGKARVLYPVDLGIEMHQSPDGIALRIPRQHMGCILAD
jgi:alpha-galactosidase